MTEISAFLYSKWCLHRKHIFWYFVSILQKLVKVFVLAIVWIIDKVWDSLLHVQRLFILTLLRREMFLPLEWMISFETFPQVAMTALLCTNRAHHISFFTNGHIWHVWLPLLNTKKSNLIFFSCVVWHFWFRFRLRSFLSFYSFLICPLILFLLYSFLFFFLTFLHSFFNFPFSYSFCRLLFFLSLYFYIWF